MSATSVRIRTTTICERNARAHALVARCDELGSPVLPARPGVTSLFSYRETHHDGPLRADETACHGFARSLARGGAALADHWPDGISHRRRSVRDAGDPSLA